MNDPTSGTRKYILRKLNHFHRTNDRIIFSNYYHFPKIITNYQNHYCLIRIIMLLFRCFLTLFRMDILWTAHGWDVINTPLPEMYQIHPTMMNLGTITLYLKKIQKIYRSYDTSLEFY